MALIVNVPQDLRKGVTSPVSIRSRIVSLGIAVGGGAGASAMIISDPVANNFTIKGITTVLSSLDPAIMAAIRWQLFIGSGATTSTAVVLSEWEPLFKSLRLVVGPDMRVIGSFSMYHSLTRRYQEKPWRFAAYIYNHIAAVGCMVNFNIEISES